MSSLALRATEGKALQSDSLMAIIVMSGFSSQLLDLT